MLFFLNLYSLHAKLKSHYKASLLNRMPSIRTCQRGLRVNVFACQHGLRETCLHAKSVPKLANLSFFCANVPINVQTCCTVCQCFRLACQRVKRHVNFSNIPLTKCYWRFLYFIIKTYIILDIIVILIICI